VQVRFMLQTALVLFIYTVVIGILNGVDLVDFERKALVAHLHVGTLSWLTIAVFAASMVVFGSNDPNNGMLRRMAVVAPVVAAAYNIAFLTTTSIVRPILGTVMLLVIVWFAVWGFRQARGVTLSVPHLGLLAGLATSVVGAVLGILLGLIISNPDWGISSRFGDAHPATMVIGFLIPVGMAFAEWTLRPESVLVKATRAGWVQIGAPSLGAVAVTLGILLDAEPLLMISLPLELIGLGVFLWRMFPGMRTRLVAVDGPGAPRHRGRDLPGREHRDLRVPADGVHRGLRCGAAAAAAGAGPLDLRGCADADDPVVHRAGLAAEPAGVGGSRGVLGRVAGHRRLRTRAAHGHGCAAARVHADPGPVAAAGDRGARARAGQSERGAERDVTVTRRV
jgi:hypothetical protein